MSRAIQRSSTDSPSFNKTQKRNMQEAEAGYKVRPDDLTGPEKNRGGFAPSVATRVLDKDPGWSGGVRPTIESHQTNKGLDTLSSDSRLGKAPLPEDGVSLNIRTRRTVENQVGRSANDVNDDNTVHGEDRGDTAKGIKDMAKGKRKS